MTTTDPRRAALRESLVTTVAATSGRSRGSRWRIGLGALAVASLLAGGTVAAVAATQAARDAAITEMAMMTVGDGARPFAEPTIFAGSGDASIDLGSAPDGADQLTLVFACISPGAVRILLDDVVAQTTTCSADDVESDTAGAFSMVFDVDGGEHTVSVSAAGSTGYSLWASWGGVPEPSEAQHAELADGTVDADEYRAAFARYESCLADAGYRGILIDDSGVLVEYAVPAAAVSDGSDARCYIGEFRAVDQQWQIDGS
jgi:hypothetical protein